MKHTIICFASKRIEVKPSPTHPGAVLVTILGADRQHQASVTMTPDGAEILSSALGIEARNALAVEKEMAGA